MCRHGRKVSLFHDWCEWTNFEVQRIEPMRFDPMTWVTIPIPEDKEWGWPTIEVTLFWQRRRCSKCGREEVRKLS